MRLSGAVGLRLSGCRRDVEVRAGWGGESEFGVGAGGQRGGAEGTALFTPPRAWSSRWGSGPGKGPLEHCQAQGVSGTRGGVDNRAHVSPMASGTGGGQDGDLALRGLSQGTWEMGDVLRAGASETGILEPR